MPKIKKTEVKKVSVVLNVIDYENLTKAAAENSLSVSDLVRQAVKLYLDRLYEENNLDFFTSRIAPKVKALLDEEIERQANRLAGHITTAIKQATISKKLIEYVVKTLISNQLKTKDINDPEVQTKFTELMTTALGEISRVLSEGKKNN